MKDVVPKNIQKERAVPAGRTQQTLQREMSILETEDAERLAKWLPLFTIELLRKKDSSRYPPATIHRILSRQNLRKRLEITILLELANSALQRQP